MLRALAGLLGLGDHGRSKRFWLVPLAVLCGTTLAFLVIGQVTAAPLYVSLPNGVVIAVVMAGLSVACLTPAADDGRPDDPPGGDDDDLPVLGCPGGPWSVVLHLGVSPPADAGPGEPVGAPPQLPLHV
ncbi:MAG TPA: hypothetical protein VLO10_05950 [Candidatus Deferrimicrobium sp.]|nr:hypothetical protein [Candidatus Deferrimicrobium sp.]